MLKKYSLVSWASYLEHMSSIDSDVSAEPYSTFNFEPLHNVVLGFSKLIKLYMIRYIYLLNCFQRSFLQ